ncbi:hypothetical protein [Pelagovum pacificum]|uniref:Uncharacterized protein n=1 Tax=Pelagovum pacificum TaxID=2588711 RepID=A0A5C5G7S3_9RHOB|nr:hypothetical protein [Pelagovum pacificum]QQA41830.1 hypothetical protein I8N54_13625 [Pelagovum pacificum]TNY30726.1 hypothetical protein FHY64_19305 [Pelagovum pacificum]
MNTSLASALALALSASPAVADIDTGSLRAHFDSIPAALALAPGALTEYGNRDGATLAVLARRENLLAPLGDTWWPAARMLPLPYWDFLIAGADQWSPTSGFAFEDIVAISHVANAPMTLSLIDLDPGVSDAVGPALLSYGYDEEMRDGQPVYWRFDDFQISITERNPGHPFDFGLGMSSRVAVTGDRLLHARGWDAMDLLLSPDTPTLASDPRAAATLDALEDPALPAGTLVRAELYAQGITVPGAIEGDTPFLLAEATDGRIDRALMLIPFEDAAVAADVADRLPAGWETMTETRPELSYADFARSALGVAVVGDAPAVLALSLEGPSVDAERRGFDAAFGFSMLQQLVILQDLGFLAP